MALVLETLPKIAAEVTAPLAKTEEIVLLGGSDKTTGTLCSRNFQNVKLKLDFVEI